MNPRSLAIVTVALALGAALPASANPAHQSHGHATEAPDRKLTLDNGRKWATDDALRTHMGAIHSALLAQRQAILARSLDEAQARALGQLIEVRVAAIVGECKLEPRADENLHIVVADLLEASDLLQGKATGSADDGAAKAVRATQMYLAYFDHPGLGPVYGAYPTPGAAPMHGRATQFGHGMR
jgi:hypothetical protein